MNYSEIIRSYLTDYFNLKEDDHIDISLLQTHVQVIVYYSYRSNTNIRKEVFNIGFDVLKAHRLDKKIDTILI